METIICQHCRLPKPKSDFIRQQKDRRGKPYQYQRGKCLTCVTTRQQQRLVERFGGLAGANMYKRLEKIHRRCRTLYNTTFEAVKAMLVSQNHRCKICEKPIAFLQTNYDQEACIDHDHSTGKTRGILCHWCNSGIGYFQDSPALLEKSIAYLRG